MLINETIKPHISWWFLPKNRKQLQAHLSACQESKRLLILDVGTMALAKTS